MLIFLVRLLWDPLCIYIYIYTKLLNPNLSQVFNFCSLYSIFPHPMGLSENTVAGPKSVFYLRFITWLYFHSFHWHEDVVIAARIPSFQTPSYIIHRTLWSLAIEDRHCWLVNHHSHVHPSYIATVVDGWSHHNLGFCSLFRVSSTYQRVQGGSSIHSIMYIGWSAS